MLHSDLENLEYSMETELVVNLDFAQALEHLDPDLRKLASHYLTGDYTEKELCSLLFITRSTLQRWKHRLGRFLLECGLGGVLPA